MAEKKREFICGKTCWIEWKGKPTMGLIKIYSEPPDRFLVKTLFDEGVYHIDDMYHSREQLLRAVMSKYMKKAKTAIRRYNRAAKALKERLIDTELRMYDPEDRGM